MGLSWYGRWLFFKLVMKHLWYEVRVLCFCKPHGITIDPETADVILHVATKYGLRKITSAVLEMPREVAEHAPGSSTGELL